jgi:thiamine pyrophosphate-dependent acetolactate synthase large subunit-like protein
MSDQDKADAGQHSASTESASQKSAGQTLAELVAKRKAQAGAGWAAALRKGDRQSERAAAARSAAKSKPMMRK